MVARSVLFNNLDGVLMVARELIVELARTSFDSAYGKSVNRVNVRDLFAIV